MISTVAIATPISGSDELPALPKEAADAARVLGIADGDGSVQLAAGLAANEGIPLLVIPSGTFNHFATDLGVRSVEVAFGRASRRG
jgi:diacylglycerol kinase family enzyme